MHKLSLFSCLTLVALPAMAEADTCSALVSRIDAQLQSKGVKIYTLEIVDTRTTKKPREKTPRSDADAPAVAKGKEIGTCDGKTKRLIYTRGN